MRMRAYVGCYHIPRIILVPFNYLLHRTSLHWTPVVVPVKQNLSYNQVFQHAWKEPFDNLNEWYQNISV